LKDIPPSLSALSWRDGFLIWSLAVAFGIIGGIVAGFYFIGYHLCAATKALRWSTGRDKNN
jgi:hypothetical protein